MTSKCLFISSLCVYVFMYVGLKEEKRGHKLSLWKKIFSISKIIFKKILFSGMLEAVLSAHESNFSEIFISQFAKYIFKNYTT